MIECVTRGVPMRKPADADGCVRFSLDEQQHDPFKTLDRLMAACDKEIGVERLVSEFDGAHNAIMVARTLRCQHPPTCSAVSECLQRKRCKLRPA